MVWEVVLVELIAEKAKSGIWGLDDILAGGFTREHMFLIEGAPGTGKTTIALQTGLELAAASRVVRPSLPVLLATGYAELPEGTQLDLPRLAKPYDQGQLRDQLDQLLS